MLEVQQLRYGYEQTMMFDGLSFALNQGNWVQLTGPNGAGKTTLLRMLSGLTMPWEGHIRWKGQSIFKSRLAYHKDMAYSGHLHALKPEFTVLENLAFAQHLWGGTFTTPKNPETLLKCVGLDRFKTALCRSLSSGQKKRLSLASTVIKNTCLWLLDEPLTSLDMDGKKHFEHLMKQHLEQGGMVALSTHDPVNLSGGHSIEIRDL